MRRQRSVIVALGAALACAQCHDWERFDRTFAGAGTTNGDFRCQAPYVLVAVSEDNVAPFIERVPLTDGAAPCLPLPLTGITSGDTVFAVAVDGARVLAAGSSGSCIIDQADDSIRESCSPYPTDSTFVVYDAFVRVDTQHRFAVSYSDGTTSNAITHLLVEDDDHKLSRSMRLRDAGLSSLFGSAEVRSIASSPEAPYRLYAARVDREEVVSATQDNMDRRVVVSATIEIDQYEALGVGPSNASGPTIAMQFHDAGEYFALWANNTRFGVNFCSPCRRMRHAVPLSATPAQQLVTCTTGDDIPRLSLRGPSACEMGRTYRAAQRLSKIAIRWQ